MFLKKSTVFLKKLGIDEKITFGCYGLYLRIICITLKSG